MASPVGSSGWPVPIPSGILSSLEPTHGPIPRLLLRETQILAERPARTSSEEVPQVVGDTGRYQLLGELARGGMGIILKGRDVDLGRDVAVKVLLERHLHRPEIVRRFVEEAQIGGQLQHPGIVPVYELGRLPDGRLYIAMKLIRGCTLAELLAGRSSPQSDRSRLLDIFEQVCQAVAYAHACGVVHRDLKPSNIMVGHFGEVFVMDWGLAKVLDRGGSKDDDPPNKPKEGAEQIRTYRSGSHADDSRAGSIFGTPAYMPPEQAQGQLDLIDERADVFGLGAILCEILTGEPPYSVQSDDEAYRQAAEGNLDHARERLNSCDADPELIELTKSCLAVSVKQRPRHAGAIVDVLRRYRAGTQERLKEAELGRVRAESRAIEERKRRRLVAGLASSVLAFVALAVVVAVVWVWQRAAHLHAVQIEATAALRELSLVLGRARSTSWSDAAAWTQLTHRTQQAQHWLDNPHLSEDLRREIQDVVDAALDEYRKAAERGKDDRTSQRLIAIHADLALHLDFARADREHAEVFCDYGIDVDQLSPKEAGERVAASAIKVDLVNALDQWAFIRRVLGPRHAASARRLSAVARAADPNPWRCRLREVLDLEQSDREAARPALRELAESVPHDSEYRESLSRLAYVLAQHGPEEKELAVTVLRRTQQAHPEDFWINYDLARTLMKSGRPAQAARFFTAAVALRPGSELAWKSLRDALDAAGDRP